MAFAMAGLLAVSLPMAAPALAVAGDTYKITVGGSTTVNAGPTGSTFIARVATNTVTPLGAIQTAVAFDNTRLSVTAVAPVAGFWTAAGANAVPGSTAAASTTAGKVSGWGAFYLTTPGSPTATDVPFLDVTFQVTACPAAATSTQVTVPLGPADGAANGAATGDAVVFDAPVPLTVNCTPPAPNDFTLAAAPTTLSIPQGGSASSNLTATYVSGTAELVALSGVLAPVNAGVSATITPGSVTPTGGAQVSFSVSGSAALGTFVYTVTGDAPSTDKTAVITITITPPPAGPAPAVGTTNVTGTVDNGYLGVSVPPSTPLRLLRDFPNTTSVPVLIFSNTQWTLSIEDAMTLPGGVAKPAVDRGHMVDPVASPQKKLIRPMTALVGANPVRTLDVAGPQSLQGGALSATVNVTLGQRTLAQDPPGNYAIDLTFSAISGF